MKTIGLCMIVKNEQKVIERCLDSVKKLIDYVCIVDTGSTDDTILKIKNWMKRNNIQGEVIEEEWKDFATNRTSAIQHIQKQQHIDYIFMIDADEIVRYDENFDVKTFKEKLTCDLYNMNCQLGGKLYDRNSIFKRTKPFYFRGVMHEFLDCKETIETSETIFGLTNIPIQDSARNEDPEKTLKDADALRKALKTEKDEYLISRYMFYLGQCLYNNIDEEALKWYGKRVQTGGWEQEIYVSLCNSAKIKERLEHPETEIIQTYMLAHETCPDRLEALYGALKICRINQLNYQGYMIGKYARSLPTYVEKKKEGLFVEEWIWDYGLDDEFVTVCYWAQRYQEGYELCLDLINRAPQQDKERIKKNLDYFEFYL